MSSTDDRSSAPSLWVAEAVLAFQRGEGREAAFERLHERFAPVTLGWLRRRGYDPETAEDLNQDTWTRIFEKLDGLDGPERFVGWMFAVVRSIWKHERRGSRALKRSGLELEAEPEDGASPLPPVESNQMERIEQDEEIQAVHEAIDELSPQQQACFRLHYLEGLKIDEIAKVLRIAPGTVKAHLNYARENLRKKLRDMRGSR